MGQGMGQGHGTMYGTRVLDNPGLMALDKGMGAREYGTGMGQDHEVRGH